MLASSPIVPVTSFIQVPGAYPTRSPDFGLNSQKNLENLATEYSAIKKDISSNNKQDEPRQGIEIEIVVQNPDGDKCPVVALSDCLEEITQPEGELNPDPETWPDALEINSKIPTSVCKIEQWFVALANSLHLLDNNCEYVALPSS